MIGIYLLVSILAQAIPASDVPALHSAGVVEISTKVEKLNGVQVGTPVMSAGNTVGSVSSIEPITDSAPGASAISSSGVFTISLRIFPRFRSLVKTGTVAIICSAPETSKGAPKVAVQLFVPPNAKGKLPHGSKILGYTSYEQFWREGFRA